MRKTALVIGLLAGALASVVLFINIDIFYKSKKEARDPERNLARLESANRLVPFSDLTLAEEGRAHLDVALANLADVERARDSLRRAESLLRRALRANPASSLNHFYYAKTLQYLGFVSEDKVPDSLPELWKAARLAGGWSPRDFDILQMLLDRWPSLSPEQQRFALLRTRKILAKENESQFRTILHLWFLNVKDGTLLDDLLPESSKLYRTYARFLGEMTLSLKTRQKLLAKAEDLDYNRAVREADAGQPDECLKLLNGIRFYAALDEEKDIGPELIRHQLLLKSALLSRAKLRLMQNRKLAEAESDLRAYLKIETDYNEVLGLETYLGELKLLKAEQGVWSVQGDLRDLAFQVFLMFCAHKYDQIVSLGSALDGPLIVPDPGQRKYLREILMLVADAYDKLNFLYEPEKFYQKALEAAPGDWEVLLKLRLYYERMNEPAKIARVNQTLDKVLTPPAFVPAESLIGKGQTRVLPLVLDAQSAALTLTFKLPEEQPHPLITLVLNGRVIWEGYLAAPDLPLQVEVQPGLNRFEVTAVNRPAEMLGLKWARPAESDKIL